MVRGLGDPGGIALVNFFPGDSDFDADFLASRDRRGEECTSLRVAPGAAKLVVCFLLVFECATSHAQTYRPPLKRL